MYVDMFKWFYLDSTIIDIIVPVPHPYLKFFSWYAALFLKIRTINCYCAVSR